MAGQLTVPWMGALGALFLLFVVVALAGLLDQESVIGEFTDTSIGREVIAETTVEAAGAFFPYGTGLGAFSDVYRTFDKSVYERLYVNHAHNDYLEIALELGLPGILLIALFVGWWLRQLYRCWSMNLSGANLARAGSIIIGIVMVHSIVDYPVRTAAIAAVFALACALMVPAPAQPTSRMRSASGDAPNPLRHLEVV